MPTAAHETLWREAHAERVSVIVDADDYFRHARSAMLKARRRILLIGWDFDTRILLGDQPPRDGGPDTLGRFVLWLVRRNPALHIYILRWDVGVLKAFVRGTHWLTAARWYMHPRIHGKLDHRHPPGASHHQKIAVIDDDFAFCGGIDMTGCRWDTRDHLAGDPRRTDPKGRPCGGWHDATSAIRGDAARAIGEIAGMRWMLAGGKPLIDPATAGDAWPEALDSDFDDVTVGIARTLPEMDESGAVHEIEALYMAMIAAARQSIYVETQYFASRRIAEAIAARLEAPGCPDIVIVHPEKADGWLEQVAMDTARARLHRMLLRLDPDGIKLRLYHPFDAHGEPIYVHAKIMIVDGAMLRIGSSNLNNRSMRLDTECDVVIDAGRPGNAAASRRITEIRDALIAEHLGIASADVSAAIRSHGLVGAVEALRGDHGRSLRPYVEPVLSDAGIALADSKLLDPEGPDEMFEPIGKRRKLVDRLRRRWRARRGAGFRSARPPAAAS